MPFAGADALLAAASRAPLGGHLWHILMLAAWLPIFGLIVWVEKHRANRSSGLPGLPVTQLRDGVSTSGKGGRRNQVQRTATQHGSNVVSFAVSGMTCGSCAARIDRTLNELEGVNACVNYATERARVTISNTHSAEDLMAEVRSLGFSADPISDDNLEEVAGTQARVDDRVRFLRRRLIVAGFLFMPLCDSSIMLWIDPWFRFPYWQWPLLVCATPVFAWAAWPFYCAALKSARHGTVTMDTLVSLGIVISVGWSVYAMFWQDTGHVGGSILYLVEHGSGGGLYLDVGAGITTFLLAGRYFEAISRSRSGDALRALVAVVAKEVSILDANGVEHRMPTGSLEVGDHFIVRPGETVATDGTVVSGHSAIDRSMLTGESVPVEVAPSDEVVGGTVSVGGRLVVVAKCVGRDTQLAQMVRLVEEAQSQKAAVQRLADRISAFFVPGVLVSGVATLLAWLWQGAGPEFAIRAGLSVVIISCPCALGLATPMALLVASGQGARFGIFFKGYQALEASRQVDTVLLDKTGTITQGKMTVVGVKGVAGIGDDTVLWWAGALEQASEHAVAQAIAAAALTSFGALPSADQFVSKPGIGSSGTVDGHVIEVGKAHSITPSSTPVPPDLVTQWRDWQELGSTMVCVAKDKAIIGAIALADTIRPSSPSAVRELQALGLRCILVTGDGEPAANAVASACGLTEVVAEALPADKVALIARLQRQGRSVAMIGDGVNDGPALASANLGIAIGSGTDVAINAADLVIVRDDLRTVATAIELSRRTIKVIRGNLIWAFAYNTAAIPMAAFGLLNPLIAAAAMTLSSSFVVWNSSRLRQVRTVTSSESTGATGFAGLVEPQSMNPSVVRV